MKGVVYTGVNIGSYDWEVVLPSEDCPASMAYSRFYKNFKPQKSDRLSFHLSKQIQSLGAVKIRDQFYFFGCGDLCVDLKAELENCEVTLYGSEDKIKELETILVKEIKLHREWNDKRLAERNKLLREAGVRDNYYKTNE